MSIIKDEEDRNDLYKKFSDININLNLDHEAQERAWFMYQKLKKRFTLEGDPMHWLCCALYIACQEARVPAVANATNPIGGNYIQLNHLLRSCSLSICDFVSKIKHWAEMINLTQDVVDKINFTERKYCITLLLFDRFKNLFEILFTIPISEDGQEGLASNTSLCHRRLYDMSWLLFLCVRNELQRVALELVDSYHLLICCLDLLYRNVLAVKRVDLLNKDFKISEQDVGLEMGLENVCIIDAICNITEAMRTEAKKLKRGHFELIIMDFLEAEILYGDHKSMLGLLIENHLAMNIKSLQENYEQYLLSEFEFDERVMPNYSPKTKARQHDTPVPELLQFQTIFENNTTSTPFTRQYLLSTLKNQIVEEDSDKDIDSLLRTVEKINKLDDFIINKLDAQIVKENNELLDEMLLKFNAYELVNIAHFRLAKSMYYYLISKILRLELNMKPDMKLETFFVQRNFNKVLMACCVELVLEAYRTELKFPWILQCFDVSSYDFVKIIEIVVLRHNGLLTRRLIKHLNTIEERCLEELVWCHTSPVWSLLANTESTTIPDENQQSTESASNAENSNTSEHAQRNKNITSKNIFLRKVYNLACLRLSKLCSALKLTHTNNSRSIIRSIFHHSLHNHALALMRNRHLDQILMCALYMYVRMEHISDTGFVDIISCYRQQPQARRSIYRRVLLAEADQYDNLINFYNKIYLPKMANFAISLKSGTISNEYDNDESTLQAVASQRISPHHDIYISHLERPNDVHDNMHLNGRQQHTFKRLFPFDDDADELNSNKFKPNTITRYP